MIFLTQEQLDIEKDIIKKEIENCKDCQLEIKLGFKRCSYHEHVVKYMMEHIEAI